MTRSTNLLATIALLLLPALAAHPQDNDTCPSPATAGTPADSTLHLHAAYGNRGNLNAGLCYRHHFGPADQLDLRAETQGRNGTLTLPDEGGDWKSHYYRTRAEADYRQHFRQPLLRASGDFALSNFNPLPGTPGSNQRLASGSVRIGVESAATDRRLRYRAETALLLYDRRHDTFRDVPRSGLTETLLRTRAILLKDIGEGRSLSLAVSMDNTFYDYAETEDYTTIVLTPAYRLESGRWRMTAGLRMGLRFGHGHAPGWRSHNDALAWLLSFGETWWLSPDVRAQFSPAKGYRLYAYFSGGQLRNDFRSLEKVHPYAALYNGSLPVSYEPIDAALGLEVTPADELEIGLRAGYQSHTNDVFARRSPHDPQSLVFDHGKLTNAYATGSATYHLRQHLTMHADASLHHWDAGTAGFAHLYLLPAFELHVQADVCPLPALSLGVGYHFASRENESPGKAAPVHNLHASARYTLPARLSLFIRLDNLLNRHYQYLAGIPAQGFHFLAGLSLNL